MYCTNCGKSVSDAATQCDACGVNLDPARRAKFGDVPPLATPALAPKDQPVVNVAPPPPQPTTGIAPGRILGGRYQLDECIGSGGMGTIYRARRLHIGDTVAVKILRPEVVENEISRERFHREARAAALLHHPNAVVIHDVGEDADGTAYIVMELLEGLNLRQVLSEQRTLTPERAYGIIRQACAALEAAHRRGIIHRDVKPDNIILLDSHDDADHIKILDFGIAKLRDKAIDTLSLEKSLTSVGTVIGTPNYMSPEQCQGETVDARSDIYSLGVVLYEMLTGALPFTAKTPTGVAIKHVTEHPKRPAELRPGLDLAIDRVVLRALEKDPAARHQTALELARDFEAAVKAGASSRERAEAPTKEIGSTSFATTAIPAAVNTGSQARSFETQVAPTPAAFPASRRSRLPLVIGASSLALILLAGLGWWYAKSRKASKATPRTETAAAVQPTPAETAQPAPSPSATGPAIIAPEGMVAVPGGEFLLGRDNGDESERPAHPVTVRPFFIDLTEVTNKQYQKFVTEKGYPAPPSWPGSHFPAGAEKLPVTDVTWQDAKAYAEWAGKRLPSEEEWEFAARGVDGRLYPWGNEWRPDLSNIAGPQGEKRQLTPVGQYSQGASPFGVLDLSGNAWEWTESDFKAYPGGAVPPSTAGYKNLKVIRGGSYASLPNQAAATYRRGWPATRTDWPSPESADYAQTGFRCAKDAPQ